MRRRAASVVLICAVLLVIGGGRAVAGGPTSVLLVAPGSGQTASLYSGDDDYELLGELLGAFGAARSSDDSAGADHAAGNGVTVTWLVHDVQVWRVDYVYPAAPGGPWVATRVSDLQGGTIWDSEVAWHRVVDGALLENLLGRLDLLPGSAPATGPEAAPAPGLDRPVADAGPAAEDGRTPAATAPPSSSTPASTAAAWVWGLAGIVLGAGVGLLVGRRRRPTVLLPGVDDPIGSADGAETADWVPDDELASSRGPGSA
jgi:hypothetical protein